MRTGPCCCVSWAHSACSPLLKHAACTSQHLALNLMLQELIRTVLQLKQQGKALRMESPKEMCMRLVRNPAILGVLLVAALLLIRFLSSSLLAVTSAATLKLLRECHTCMAHGMARRRGAKRAL